MFGRLKAKLKEFWAMVVLYSIILATNKRRAESRVVRSIIAFLLLAILFPIAMSQVISANTSGWNSAVAVVFTVLAPVLVIIGAALLFLRTVR